MTFYLEKAIFVNRAPFNHLELDFKKKGINVLSAVNGMGKTTILSHVVDALYEMAKTVFSQEFEDLSDKYYRVSSPIFNIKMNEPSYVYFRFKNDEDSSFRDYLDIRNFCTEEAYNEAINLDGKIEYSLIQDYLKESSNVKIWSRIEGENEKVKKLFSENVITYFPSYRYECPSYLNNPYQITLDFKKASMFAGRMTNPIEVVSDISDLSNWIMDVVLDLRSGERYEIHHLLNNNTVHQVTSGPESSLWQNLNRVLSLTLSSKKHKGIIRFGVGPRNYGAIRLSIVEESMDESNKRIERICPSIFNLSSGELSLLALFGEVLRQADNLKNNIELADIQGVVLIDEVDKHLHIKLQREVLPKLFSLFPNIQFIVSSHSPFLSMGLADIDNTKERTHIIDLDHDGMVCEPANNEQYRVVYNMMVNDNKDFYDNYKKLQSKLDELTKPIVITEGQTDIIHILKAKEKLGIEFDFDTISTDKQPSGDGDLLKLLDQLCRVKHTNKIIAILDCDSSDIVKKIDGGNDGYKSYGNNVYAFCISAPQSRIDNGQKQISIEYLYSDDEIHKTLPNGCQLFFGNEFSEKTGVHIKRGNLVLKKDGDRGKPKIVECTGGQEVCDIYSEKNILAKKTDFAKAIKNEEICISQESWNNFNHIFEKIATIIKS